MAQIYLTDDERNEQRQRQQQPVFSAYSGGGDGLTDDERQERQRGPRFRPPKDLEEPTGFQGPGPVRNDAFPTPPPQPQPSPQTFDADAVVRDIARRFGISVEGSDITNLAGKAEGDRAQFIKDLEAQATTRAAPTRHRVFDSQSSDPAQIAANARADANPTAPRDVLRGLQPQPAPSIPFPGTAGSGPGPGGMSFGNDNRGTPAWNGPQATSVPAQFSDPITKFLESFAQRRAQELENPPTGSGQQLLEDAIRRISAQLEAPSAYEQSLQRIAGQFESGGFTPAEQEIFTTQQIEPLEQLRQARRQQVMHELTARGIPPTSGVALQMLQDVDRQFDALRIQNQSQLASRAANEKMSRMMAALQQLGAANAEEQSRRHGIVSGLSGLAGTQNQRLDQAYQYRTVPVNLADRSFNQAERVFNMNEGSANNANARAFNMLNATGNPLSLVQPLSMLANQQQGRDDAFQRGLADLLWMLTRGGQN